MATRAEKTKEQRIKSEKTRLKGIFKDLDENKKKLVTPLIEKAAFMSVELDDLQETIEQEGWTREPVRDKEKPRGRNVYSFKQELCSSH